MAQTQGATNFAYVCTAELINANTRWVTCDSGDMSAFSNSTTGPATEITTNGFNRNAGTKLLVTTTVTNDTAQIYHLYTANANQNVNGHLVMSAAAAGNAWAWCVYAATQAMQNTDTLNAITNFQIVGGL